MKRLLLALLLVLFFAPGVQAQEPFKVYLPMILTGFNQDNNWRIIQPAASTNYVLNPSGEIAGNFAALAGTTVTRVTTYQKYGLYSYRVQANADNEGATFTLLTLTNANHYVTMRARGTLPASWDWSLDNATYHQPKLIEKIDQDWNLYGFHIQATEANGSTTLYVRQNGAGSGDFYLDGIQVEPLDYWTTYIDGTQEGCAWLGPEHAAASERSGASLAGGQSVDFFTEYGFQVQKIIGGGAVSHNLGVDSYAILPGGELNSDKIVPREFQIIGKFIAETEADLLEQKRALESAFYTGDRQLTRIRFNGGRVQKEIAVRYRSGLEGDLAAFYGNVEIIEDERYMEHLLYTEKAALQVVAPYPYWQEVGESAGLLDTEDTATFYGWTGRVDGQWQDFGPPNIAGTYNFVYALAEDATYIYIGGDFDNWDNIANADNIVRYHKTTGVYSALDVGLNGDVRAIKVAANGDVYIAGAFTNAGGVAAADYITRWDGTNYNAVGTPVSGAAAITAVYALVFDAFGNLIIGGAFTNWANIAAADNIVLWDGSAYSALSTGIANSVLALALGPGNILYAGDAVDVVRSWNGSAFTTLSGLTGIGGAGDGIKALVTSPDGILYAAGKFSLGSTFYIASWNGSAWNTMGQGMDGEPQALAFGPDGALYAASYPTGFDFTNTQLSRWNGYAWTYSDVDLDLVVIYAILLGPPDPVIRQNFPIYLGISSNTNASFAGLTTAVNEGNVPAFPKIVFGPTAATLKTLKNERTGKEIVFNYALLSGETLTIDLSPTQRSVISSFFGSRQDAIVVGCDISEWKLLPGNNNITAFTDAEAYLLWREAYSGY